MVAEAMARQHLAGVTVSIVQNGAVVFRKGYGFARLNPLQAVDPDKTLFRLGDISQTFTWIGVMREVEAGRIRLDQPVNLYLPERVRVRDQGYDQPVRVMDLMDHSAGFEDRAFGQVFEADPEFVRPLELYLRRERPRRVRPPGSVSTMSNYGAALAGEAISWVSGKTFERLMEEEILSPLGLRHTTFREPRAPKAALPAPMPEALAADVADGFRWRDGGFDREPYAFSGQVAPAASASSTAGDMARYMLAQLGDGQLDGVTIYSAPTAKAFRTPLLATPPGVNGWAHGFAVETLPGGRQGFGADGSTLSFAAHMVTVPELNLGVFVAVNSIAGERLVHDLPRAIVRQFYTPPSAFPPPPSPELAAHAAAFSGHYMSTRRAYSGLEAFIGRLLGANEVQVAPEGRLLTRSSMDGLRSWTPEGAPEDGRFVSREGDERLVFHLRDGAATSFQTSPGEELYERVGFWGSVKALALLAALTAVAAVATLAGAAFRNRRELRETQIQSRAGLVQNIQAGLWLAAGGLFIAWSQRNLDPAHLVFGWPGPLLVTGSACGLVAGALTVTTLVALPSVWQGGRRVDSWTVQRKLAFSVTVVIYALFTFLLARAGALSPWSR
jgi:CubicO group peptidase (beta-lactamase class C family)